MNPRLSLYFSEEAHEKFKEIKSYLKESSALQKQYRNNSATLVTLIEVFYKLFIELGEGKNFYERLTQLEKNFGDAFDSGNDNKAIHRQLDQILYLTLTNFHAITKDDFDVQDLESIYSRLDPTQHELMARINDVIQEDVARGQTIKHSH